ncbi:hypothetical protein C9J47_10405 [Photobacterium indicum]|uniref:Uncharacterized protein n=1 Tax=Photobacterium indicum TaxID=81447 RepID=A0A2T3LC41_9GAMM|nr:hypothetical protein C9J47_10405 [Photobacterium indicum]
MKKPPSFKVEQERLGLFYVWAIYTKPNNFLFISINFPVQFMTVKLSSLIKYSFRAPVLKKLYDLSALINQWLILDLLNEDNDRNFGYLFGVNIKKGCTR